MRLFLTILFVLGSLSVLNAQHSNKQMKMPKPKGDLNCYYKSKYSADERNKFYPFNSADIIKLVSFRYHKNNYPIGKNGLAIDSLIESKTLTNEDISNLTDILFNNFYKRQPNYGVVTQCFFPRNAIIFLDKFGNLTDYILLCFHCNRHQEGSDSVKYGDECEQKVELLRDFFISKGIMFGTDAKIESYPGEDFDD
jgi:hypothetical protein